MQTCGSYDENGTCCKHFKYLPIIGFWCLKHDIPAYKDGWCSDYEPLSSYAQPDTKVGETTKVNE